jgi:hypothetical protein
MNISSIGGGSIASSPSSVGQGKSATGSKTDGSTFESLMNSGTPYDEVKVNLPNGISVGVVRFGSGGLDSNALKSIEDFVQKMASQKTSGNSGSNADRADDDDSPDAIGVDEIHVDLPNGLSFEVLRSSGGQPTEDAAVMKQLTDIAEELTEGFAKYSPASTAADTYARQQVASSGAISHSGD